MLRKITWNGWKTRLNLMSLKMLFNSPTECNDYEAKTSLYFYNDKYYLHVVYDSELMDDKQKTNMFSVLSEFGVPTKTTIHLLEEYGDLIIESDVFTQIEKFF